MADGLQDVDIEEIQRTYGTSDEPLSAEDIKTACSDVDIEYVSNVDQLRDAINVAKENEDIEELEALGVIVTLNDEGKIEKLEIDDAGLLAMRGTYGIRNTTEENSTLGETSTSDKDMIAYLKINKISYLSEEQKLKNLENSLNDSLNNTEDFKNFEITGATIDISETITDDDIYRIHLESGLDKETVLAICMDKISSLEYAPTEFPEEIAIYCENLIQLIDTNGTNYKVIEDFISNMKAEVGESNSLSVTTEVFNNLSLEYQEKVTTMITEGIKDSLNESFFRDLADQVWGKKKK